MGLRPDETKGRTIRGGQPLGLDPVLRQDVHAEERREDSDEARSLKFLAAAAWKDTRPGRSLRLRAEPLRDGASAMELDLSSV